MTKRLISLTLFEARARAEVPAEVPEVAPTFMRKSFWKFRVPDEVPGHAGVPAEVPMEVEGVPTFLRKFLWGPGFLMKYLVLAEGLAEVPGFLGA